MINKDNSKTITFRLGDMIFEYDEWKNEYNMEHHGISLKHAARVFFDYDRIELYDEAHSNTEDRYNTIGDLSAGYIGASIVEETVIGNISAFSQCTDDIIFVVYTERIQIDDAGAKAEITRLISARFATNFERGLYYGKCQ